MPLGVDLAIIGDGKGVRVNAVQMAAIVGVQHSVIVCAGNVGVCFLADGIPGSEVVGLKFGPVSVPIPVVYQRRHLGMG